MKSEAESVDEMQKQIMVGLDKSSLNDCQVAFGIEIRVGNEDRGWAE